MKPRRILPALLAVAALGLTACGGGDSAAAPPPQSRFAKVVHSCNVSPSVLADEGRTISLDGKGEKDTSGMGIDKMACVMVRLEMPQATVDKIDRTTAMMGVQEDSWDGINISWTYHPDNGLDVIFQDTK